MKTPRAIRSARRPAEASGPFVCSWSSVGDCAIVRVAGTVDVRTAPTFAHELHHVITTKLPRLVVDLRRVTAMEATGLDVLADAHDLALHHGGWLRASGAGQWLADLIRATGTNRPLDHYSTLSDALPSYRPAIARPASPMG
ncbi:STAS domain-containing protein [Kribbella sindirgiensis]|uniref:Anti-sigma factor antagonist n=1 Tax=Kribbella sindirgiensis TaxID=1124744 RepID=A0A4V2M3U7_9ACTN|nr:STAS domain-containing protein [Kribbella sindirgiensis]TCC33422.1 anti-sigma factor antagonist [Kribbella sindirgiensis]